MNCQAVQNQILNLPDPRELTPALREHVLTCSACQAWARGAARLESLLERLPIPPAPGAKKEALLGELMQADPVIRPMAAPATRPGFGLVAVRFLRRNASVVGGLAAAVLVAVGVYWLWPRPQPETVKTPPPERHPLLQKIVAGNTAMARANTTTRRLEILGGMADDIATDTRGMARIANGAELRQMAGWYDDVVKDGMVKQIDRLNDVPEADKKKLLNGLADKLAADAAAADRLSGEVPQDAQPALQRMAATARAGEHALRRGK
ncbi:MAG: hypothetical protein J0I06_15780 [Planctomycetes bacterium]|nr:hypothetical protein [Planctomycetota bacterium]